MNKTKKKFQGGTTLDDYRDVDKGKLRAFVTWREELYHVWRKSSRSEKMSWEKNYSIENQRKSTVDFELREIVIERDKNTCRYCGKRLIEGSEIHIDHIHPSSKGGETTLENLATACARCNKEKWYLHGIRPLPIDSLEHLETVIEANLSKSRTRQERLIKSWKQLKQDRKQHNLEAEYFFYYYEKCRKLDHETLKKMFHAGQQSDLERVYDVPGWIASYLIKQPIIKISCTIRKLKEKCLKLTKKNLAE